MSSYEINYAVKHFIEERIKQDPDLDLTELLEEVMNAVRSGLSNGLYGKFEVKR